MQKYLDRDPALRTVLDEKHFRYKIQYFTDLVDAARTLLLRRLPRLEDYPRTKQGVMKFLRDIRQSGLNHILASTDMNHWLQPRRPNTSLRCNAIKDSFMMDFENSCLANKWGSRPHPKGDKRHLDKDWAKMIQSQVYPHHSDVDWYEYVDWVSRGFGDEWFQV